MFKLSKTVLFYFRLSSLSFRDLLIYWIIVSSILFYLILKDSEDEPLPSVADNCTWKREVEGKQYFCDILNYIGSNASLSHFEIPTQQLELNIVQCFSSKIAKYGGQLGLNIVFEGPNIRPHKHCRITYCSTRLKPYQRSTWMVDSEKKKCTTWNAWHKFDSSPQIKRLSKPSKTHKCLWNSVTITPMFYSLFIAF